MQNPVMLPQHYTQGYTVRIALPAISSDDWTETCFYYILSQVYTKTVEECPYVDENTVSFMVDYFYHDLHSEFQPDRAIEEESLLSNVKEVFQILNENMIHGFSVFKNLTKNYLVSFEYFEIIVEPEFQSIAIKGVVRQWW